jgi:hypothetical protein
MSEFWMAGNEVSDLAKELIAKHHSEIATAEICYVYKDKASASEIESGQVGVAKKVSGLWHTLTDGKDFAVVLTYQLWNELSSVEQTAMLDSALESCIVKKDKDGEDKLDDDGNPEWALKPHDIVGHSAIIARYGLDVFTKIGECARAAILKDKVDGLDGAIVVQAKGDVVQDMLDSDGLINDEETDDKRSDGGTKKSRKTKKGS